MPKKMTHDEFVKRVFGLVGSEYRVIGDYTNNNTKILIHHSCGNDYDVTPHKFTEGRRCPKCFKNYKKTTEQFKQEVFDVSNGEYQVVGEYVNSNTLIAMRHKCGNEYSVTPNKFLMGRRCPECSKIKCGDGKRKTHDDFIAKVNEITDEYEILTKYKLSKLKIKVLHKKCGSEYEVSPNSFLDGNRCPVCISSNGEKVIAKYFNDKGIIFKRQYKMNGCRNKMPLAFDFAIRDETVLIEYDGEQHRRVSWGGTEGLKYRQSLDKIKNDYCKNNNIKLIRIPYAIVNIEEYLDNELKNLA